MSYITELATIMQSEKYKGCIIMKVKGGWSTLGRTYGTKQEARTAIDSALQLLKTTI